MHKKHKKGDLSLSVNAIVVFVLAFSMLGVGLFVVNLIKDKVSTGIGVIDPSKDLKQPPSSENPLTLDDEINIKKDKLLTQNIGFYNKADTTINNVVVTITGCVDTDPKASSSDVSEADLPSVHAPILSKVESGNSAGLKISLQTSLKTGTYICTLVIKGTDDSNVDLEESKQFFLKVTT